VRDILVCHCTECQAATGGAWAASAAARRDLVVEDPTAVVWAESSDSEHGASRGSCASCGTVVFWDAPARDTVSVGAATLAEALDLPTVAHIWVPVAERKAWPEDGPRAYERGLPASSHLAWRI
jgi:hypothetical protein